MKQAVAEGIERWTIELKSALAIQIIRDWTTVAGAKWTFDLAPSVTEERLEWGAPASTCICHFFTSRHEKRRTPNGH